MFFFNSGITTKKNKHDIILIFRKLLNQPHKCAVSINNEHFETYIQRVDSVFAIKDINFNFSRLNEQNKKIKFKIIALFDFEQYNIDFNAELNPNAELLQNQIEFLFPAEIKFSTELYELLPAPEDKLTVIFSFNNVQEIRYISKMTMKEIYFDAPMEHLLKYYENKTIYNIEVKLPFDKIVISGIFKKLKKEHYYFTDFLLGMRNHDAMISYFQYHFMRFYGIPSLFDERKAMQDKEDRTRQGCIFICDDKPAVTEYLCEFLSHRITQQVIQLNEFKDIFVAAEQYFPLLIIIDAQLPDIELIEMVKELQILNCPLLFLANKTNAAILNHLEGSFYKGYVYKPVDGYLLLNKMKTILEI